MKFRTTILKTGENTTGIEVPENIVLGLGGNKRPLVKVIINNYAYRSAIASRGDRYLLGVSADVRAAASVAGGDEVDIELELDTSPREISVPSVLVEALAADAKAKAVFDGLSNSKKQLYINPIANAKTTETSERNLKKAMDAFRRMAE